MVTLAEFMSYGAMIRSILICIGVVFVVIAFSKTNNRFNTDGIVLCSIIAISLIVMLGMHPIGFGLGSDRQNYVMGFLDVQSNGLSGQLERDPGFSIFNYVVGLFCDYKQYLFVVAGVYLFNYLFAIKHLCGTFNYWMLLAVILSMGFVTYNINTMRAGLALSFLLLGYSVYPHKVKMLIFAAVAISIHNSVAIPVAMAVISYLYPNKTKTYYILWLLSVPVSFAAGTMFNTLLSTFSEDERTNYLITTDSGYNIGFRIDFIIYSLVPFIVGGYYIFKKGFKSKLYRFVYNCYVLTNIFWILVIKANYSDRFAYLSWCLIPFVLMLPLVKQPNLVNNPNQWIAIILLGEAIFLLI